MLVYCIGGLVYGSYNEFDQRLIIQILVSGIGSLVILSGYVFAWVKNFKFPKIKLPKKQEKEKVVDDLSIDEKSLKDFKCLHYLKNRAEEINCKEMLDIVTKLNTLLFNDCCKQEDKK